MNIKKMFFVIVATLVMITSTCFAQITMEDLNIGGMYLGQPFRDVAKIYKNPVDTVEVPPKGFEYIFLFDDNVAMLLRPSGLNLEESVLNKITVNGFHNDDLVMNSGIKLGSTMQEVMGVYGNPDVMVETQYFLNGEYYLTREIKRFPVIMLEYDVSWTNYLCFYFLDNKVCGIVMEKDSIRAK